jgi:hypothetical protein
MPGAGLAMLLILPVTETTVAEWEKGILARPMFLRLASLAWMRWLPEPSKSARPC